MKNALVMAMVLASGLTMAADAQLALADARAKIGDAIADPAVATSTIKQLADGDQVHFLGDVNAAIGKMPGSIDSQTADYLKLNRAMLKGANKGNLRELVGEVFATVPLEALTVVNENFAESLFNRSANPAVTYTDEKFTEIAEATQDAINAHTAKVDDSAVRSGFGVLMLYRASNGTPTNLLDKLTAKLPAGEQTIAREEWFPSALGEGREKTYAPMLGYAGAGQEPEPMMVMRLVGSIDIEMLLTDLTMLSDNQRREQFITAAMEVAQRGLPYGGYDGGDMDIPERWEREDDREPDGYQWQTTH